MFSYKIDVAPEVLRETLLVAGAVIAQVVGSDQAEPQLAVLKQLLVECDRQIGPAPLVAAPRFVDSVEAERIDRGGFNPYAEGEQGRTLGS